MKNILAVLLTVVVLFCCSAVAFASDDMEILPDGGYEIGDVDMDRDISIMDATALQIHLAQIYTLSDEKLKLADTNYDGVISITDVTHIQMHIAGLLDIIKPTVPSTEKPTVDYDKPIELPFVPAH